jgi:hypothetical protein
MRRVSEVGGLLRMMMLAAIQDCGRDRSRSARPGRQQSLESKDRWLLARLLAGAGSAVCPEYGEPD